MATPIDYYNTGVSGSAVINNTNDRESQTFTASESYSIASVKLLMYRENTPGTVTVEIKATNVGGEPTGPVLATGTTDGDTLPTTYQTAEWREITFAASYALTSGTKYAIIVYAATSDSSNKLYPRLDATSPTYTGGSRVSSTDAGSNWSIDTSRDFMFETYIGVPGKPTNPSPSNTASSITLDETPLTWDASSPAADTYEIYFREQGDSWSLIGVAQAGVSYDLSFGTLDYNITYEWRIDATNDAGTTTGTTWSFDTISFLTILPGDPGGSGGGGGGGGSGEESSPTGKNNMITLRRLVAAANNKIWYEDI